MDEDCKLTELWRTPFSWVPKVQSAQVLISQAKGQSGFTKHVEFLFICQRIALSARFAVFIY